MRFLAALFLMALLISSVTLTNFAFGYEKENHYWLKIALALNCGFTLDEARLIGIGDFSIDEDDDTKPVRPGSGKDNAKWKWHALPTENPDVDKSTTSTGNQEIKQRQHELYDRAMNEKNTPMKLFKFGQYLHYQEDKWSHWGYTTGIGHAVPNVTPGMTSPDETHADPDHYRDMAFDSMVNLGKLAKSLGKDTQCVSSLVPLDTYHSAPEYGSDFPWFSPQEIKRAQDPAKFQQDVVQYLDDWGKTALINEVITESQKNGDEGVTESFINYIANHTGKTTSDISKKYDYTHIDIDENGNAKKIPDNLIKSVTPKKDTKKQPAKESTKTASKTDDGQAALLKASAIMTGLQAKNSNTSALDVLKLVKQSLTSTEYKNLVKALDDQILNEHKTSDKSKITDTDRANTLITLMGISNLKQPSEQIAPPTIPESSVSPDLVDVKNAIRDSLSAKKNDDLQNILNDIESNEKHLAELVKQTTTKTDQAARIQNTINAINSDIRQAKTMMGYGEYDKIPQSSVNEIKSLYKASLQAQKIASIIGQGNDLEAKALKGILDSTKGIYTKTKNADAKKLTQKIETQLKDTESDKKQLVLIATQSKKITTKLVDAAKENKIAKADLDKAAKDSDKTKSSKEKPSKELKQGDFVPGLGRYGVDWGDTYEDMMYIMKTQAEEMQKAEEKLLQAQQKDAPPESILDDLEISGPDAKAPQKSDQNAKPKSDEKNPDAPPESILDDVDVSGPDTKAPKQEPKSYTDWSRIAEEDMKITQEAMKAQLQNQLKDIQLQVELQRQLHDLKQKIVIVPPKTESIIQKEPAKIPDTKPAKTIPQTTTPVSNTKPTLSIPKSITVEATGPSGASVGFTTSSQDKEDGSLSPICDHPPGSTFSIGTTPVSCTVQDSNGNSVSGTFSVTVRDTTPPAFGPFQPTEGVRDDSGVQVFFDVTATDLVDGSVPVSCNYQSGYKFPPGVTDLKCTTTDSRGNQSTKTIQITVTVKESAQ